jgi:prepilin-type N-terminal cleavage/methylation domain-containing protein
MTVAKSQDGFTLVEVLVASAIVISAIGVILQLFSSGLTGIHKAGNTQHLILAQRQLYNSLDVIDFSSIPEQSGVIVGVNYHWIAKPQGGPAFMLPDDNGANITIQLYRVQVEMTYQSKQQQFEFTKLLHKVASR